MIILAGIPSEPPLQLAFDAAEVLGVEAVLLNQREAGSSDLRIEHDGKTARVFWHRSGSVIELSNANGIYSRMGTFDVLPEYKRSKLDVERARIAAWHALFSDWSETTSIRMLNRLKACNANMSKPYQARLIRAHGLDTPRSLITNDPDEAMAFKRDCGAVIFKSISAHRSIVKKLEGRFVRDIGRIRSLPVQFQEFVEGTDIRVHVIGEKLFATEIICDADDYRYAAKDDEYVSYEPTTLPTHIADACIALSKASDLPLCGIDLRKRTEGGYVCFEINPSPAYSCYEKQTGQPIANAIVLWLDGKHERRSEVYLNKYENV